MINEERVKKLCKIGIYEQNEEKTYRQAGQYYRSDYIGKEFLKSIFTGTFAYGLLALLWVMGSWEEVLKSINNLEIINTVFAMLVVYVGFIAVYLFATIIVYWVRYNNGKAKITEYKDNLKNIHQMYEREEKLKK